MWQNAALQIGVPMGNSFAASHKNSRRIPPLSSVMVWAPFIKNSRRQREIRSEWPWKCFQSRLPVVIYGSPLAEGKVKR